MTDYTIQLEDTPASQDVEFVYAALYAYNRQYASEDEYKRLCLFIRDEANTIVGGLLGETAWGWLHVSILWISEQLRGQGYGSHLLALAEAEALRRGCYGSHLDTLSFQALPFYQKYGYTLFGQLDDFPAGHIRYFLYKRFDLSFRPLRPYSGQAPGEIPGATI
jgi:GNAT superfamily N-acetyltransferase